MGGPYFEYFSNTLFSQVIVRLAANRLSCKFSTHPVHRMKMKKNINNSKVKKIFEVFTLQKVRSKILETACSKKLSITATWW